ncbi:sigma-54-dependent Fis family transcriptional regulator [Salinicola endophyticus]|uniref:Sigma-54-dependent Fis family transcriptional regulator n=1 Tax=Salinicola endophyticus TaxID=1949083 RepID=A0ABY8FJ59_9GAMM|nr:sigma-54-dependent Fis family transcriptional regulator [Salinicola endophyticus]WFF42085.1 sigma-54-dependent Fis family transcriptional regulator [Salinicola endophyticus]
MELGLTKAGRFEQAQRQHIAAVARLGEGREVLAGREIIQRSWRRCVDDYRLDPSRPRPVRVLTHEALVDSREPVDELLYVARAGVDQLFAQVAPMGYVLLLTDRHGVTVDFRGHPEQDAALRRAGLYLGADWDERHAGTCAVGTCIHEARALTCHQREHFDATHIALTCTAAPIHDPQGRPIAVLDISALQSPRGLESQSFGLPLVTLYARMIEDAYFLHRYRDTTILRFDTTRAFVHFNGRGLIAFDAQGRVLAANGEGRALIAAHAQRTPPAPTQVTQLFEAELDDLLALPRCEPDQLRALRLRASGEIRFAALVEPRGLRRHRRDAEPICAATDAVTDAAGEIHDPVATTSTPALDRLAGDDPAMQRLLDLARRLCRQPLNVLIRGETGTGKEVLARALHASGDRAEGAFVAVNCAAIPEALIESELFGYLPGAFTGGNPKGMRGLIAQADGGTLFLDEIGDMPLTLQSRLLRVLAEQEVMPLGAERPVKVALRVVTATHRDLAALIAEGRFREDLYYRLNGAELILPPLRERADRRYLIQRLFAALTAEQGGAVQLRADALHALLDAPWPGNVRQLKSALAFALATREGETITVHDLPESCRADRVATPPISATSAIPRTTQLRHESDDAPAEAESLARALAQAGWNVSQVARQLGVSRPTLYRRMRRHGLVPPNRREALGD